MATGVARMNPGTPPPPPPPLACKVFPVQQHQHQDSYRCGQDDPRGEVDEKVDEADVLFERIADDDVLGVGGRGG